LSFVAAKIQQNCTGTGNYNSKATRQGIICAVKNNDPKNFPYFGRKQFSGHFVKIGGKLKYLLRSCHL
jgi:hypothetical protein